MLLLGMMLKHWRKIVSSAPQQATDKILTPPKLIDAEQQDISATLSLSTYTNMSVCSGCHYQNRAWELRAGLKDECSSAIIK